MSRHRYRFDPPRTASKQGLLAPGASTAERISYNPRTAHGQRLHIELSKPAGQVQAPAPNPGGAPGPGALATSPTLAKFRAESLNEKVEVTSDGFVRLAAKKQVVLDPLDPQPDVHTQPEPPRERIPFRIELIRTADDKIVYTAEFNAAVGSYRFDQPIEGTANIHIDDSAGPIFRFPDQFEIPEPSPFGDRPLPDVAAGSSAQLANASQFRTPPISQALAVEEFEVRLTNLSDRPWFIDWTFGWVEPVGLYTLTAIPAARVADLLEGALRGLTPNLRAERGQLVISVEDEYSNELGIPDKTIDLDGDLESFAMKLTPVDFRIRPVKDMVRDQTVRLKAFVETLPRSPGVFHSVSDEFVERVTTVALAGGNTAREVERQSSLTGVEDSLLTRLGVLKTSFIRLEDNDFGLETNLRVEQVRADSQTAVGTAEISVGLIEVSIQIFFSQGRLISPACVYVDLDDIDIFLDTHAGIVDPIVEPVANALLGAARHFINIERLAEDKMRDGILGFFKDNVETFSARVEETFSEIARRGERFVSAVLEAGNLIVTTETPTARRPQRQRVKRQPSTPIDGAVVPEALDRLKGIDHIVVIMMENRSFDHMLGYLSADGGRRDIDGIHPNAAVPTGLSIQNGPPLFQTPVSSDTDDRFIPDPPHGFGPTTSAIGDGSMNGFLDSYGEKIASSKAIIAGTGQDKRKVMLPERIVRHQTAETVFLFDFLAKEYMIANRWFASFPGGTYANRMCALTGTTVDTGNDKIFEDMGYHETLTLFDCLDRSGTRWEIFESDVAFARFFKRLRLDFKRIRPIDQFFAMDLRKLAPVTFIEPNVLGLPSAEPGNDDHPPLPVLRGQNFLTRVLAKLSSNAAVWAKTMVIITYDEHGGFYDHVPPPGSQKFKDANPGMGEIAPVHDDASTYGVRVPTFIVSPRVPAMSVADHIYCHATTIRTILERFSPNEIGFMPPRVLQARHLGEVLSATPRATKPFPPPRPASKFRAWLNPGFYDLLIGDREDKEVKPPGDHITEDARVVLSTLGRPRIRSNR